MRVRRMFQKRAFHVSMGLVIAIAVLIIGLIGYLTVLNLNRQRDISLQMLEEKGAALIRAFEAGTRSAMMESQWGIQGLNRLLMETGQQPDIAYILVINDENFILTHNDPSFIGKIHKLFLPFNEVIKDESVHSGVVKAANIFEVYKKFTPTGPLFRGMATGHGRGWGRNRRPPQMMNSLDRMISKEDDPNLVISVGLKMDAFDRAREADTRQAVTTALILLAVGISGSLLIYMGQGYANATSSLSKERALSHTIVQHMPIGLMTFGPDRKVSSANETARMLLGLRPVEGGTEENADDIARSFDSILSELEGRYHVVEKEMAFKDKSGKIVPLQLSATQLFDDRDRYLGYVLLIKDLSEIHTLKEKIEKNRTLAAIGRLAAGLAHEIRNPLSSLKGFAVYFKERYAANIKDQEIAGIMIHEVERLNRVINQLLDLSRPVRLSKTLVSINEFLKDSVLRIERMASDKKILMKRMELDKDRVLAIDSDSIHQALLNLYINAIESMPGGGEVFVKTSLKEEDEVVEICVEDTGTGISEKALSHIFEPYFTTKSTGSGIGLAMVHNIISAHNGTIHVNSKEGEGTKMTIRLPVTDGKG